MKTIKAVYAHTLWQKTIGLLGKERLFPLIIKTRWGIHTFGMKKPIDVIIVHNNKVVVLKENLSPQRIFVWNPFYQTVVELP